MSSVDRARELARLLAPLLQGAVCTRPADAEQPRPEAPTDPTDPDVDLAMRLELEHVIRKSPDVLPPPDASQEDLERAGERLYELFTNGDGHAREVLWALLSGEEGQPHPGALRLAAASPPRPRGQRGGRGRSVLWPLWNKTAVRFAKSAALRRQVASP